MTPIMAVADLALKAVRDAESSCPPRFTVLLERMQLLAEDFIQRSTRLLDASRIRVGNLRLEPSAVDLSALVRSVAQKHDVMAARLGSPVELDIEDGVVGWLDPLSAEQVVENLLRNALKSGLGRPVAVRLWSDGRSARLEVQDRGIDLAPEQQARLFGRLEQAVGPHRDTGFDVGLLASRLVAGMGGRITVTSRVGEGLTFAVILPFPSLEPNWTTHDAF